MLNRPVAVLVLSLAGAIGWRTHAAQPTPAQKLFEALRKNDSKAALELLQSDAALVNARDNNQRTPLHAAAGQANKELVDYLLSKGADVHLADSAGCSALHCAASKDIAAALLEKGFDLQAKTFSGATPAHVLAQEDARADVLKYLLERGAVVAALDNSGSTPLHYAASTKGPAVKAARLLLEHKAGVNAGNHSGQTPLHCAAYANPALAALLLDNGAEVNVVDKKGRTPLFLAADAGYGELVKALLQKKGNAGLPDANGWTPLHRAVVGGHKEAVAALLAAAADVTIPNRYGETPLYWALALGRGELASLLTARGATQLVLAPQKSTGSQPSGAPGPKAELVARMISQMPIRQGLALDLGCGDTVLAAALAQQAALSVYCVDSDPAVIEKARQSLAAKNLYGAKVSARTVNFEKLPYPDSCFNLVVCGDEFANGKRDRNFKELVRVLSPNGIALIGQSASANGKKLTKSELEGWLKEADIQTATLVEKDGLWAQFTHPRPASADDWRYRGHDPGNTFGSHDGISVEALRLQWISDWEPTIPAAGILLGDGRMITVGLEFLDRGRNVPLTPCLEAFDAYTGIKLWARTGLEELPYHRPTTDYSPSQPCQDMMLLGDSLYVLGGYSCYEFAPGDGSARGVFPLPAEAKPQPNEIWLYLSGLGEVLYGGLGVSPNLELGWNSNHPRGVSRALFAVNRKTGKLVWLFEQPLFANSLCVGDGKMYFCDTEYALHALDLETGKDTWAKPATGFPDTTDIVKGVSYAQKYWLLYNPAAGRYDKLRPRNFGSQEGFFGDPMRNGRKLTAFSVQDGSRLFEAAFKSTVGCVSFAGNSVYSAIRGGGSLCAADVETGALKWAIAGGFACGPVLASRHAVFERQGAPSYVNLQAAGQAQDAKTLKWESLAGIRPTCAYPALPANGMLYIQAVGCRCNYPLRGLVTVMPGKPAEPDPGSRLVKGDAYGQEMPATDAPSAWRTWRCDSRRSSRSAEKATGLSAPVWMQTVSGKPTPLAAAEDLVFLGTDQHRFYAFEAASGKLRWERVAEGAVHNAPFYRKGRVYFADDGGWLHCLRADNGALLWRFRAALADDTIVGYGQLISRWPLGAGVVVEDGTAYVMAGLFPQEKATLCAADALTGTLRWEQVYQNAAPPYGHLALANDRLYFTERGLGWIDQIVLSDKTHRISECKVGGYLEKYHEVMVYGDEPLDLLGATPDLSYSHHFGSPSRYFSSVLPIVTEDRVYLMSGDSRNPPPSGLTAYRRELCKRGAARFYPVPEKDKPDPLLWLAWPQVKVTAILLAGDTLFTGGKGLVCATQAAGGKELGSASLPGTVIDLAFNGGRLFACCDNGAVACFGAK